MSIDAAEAAFAHARTQDTEDALYVLFEGLDELVEGLREEIGQLRKEVAELKGKSN